MQAAAVLSGLVDRHGSPLTKPERYRIWPFVKPGLRALQKATGCRWFYAWPFTFRCEHGCLIRPYALLTKGPLHAQKQARAWHLQRLAPTLLAARKRILTARAMPAGRLR